MIDHAKLRAAGGPVNGWLVTPGSSSCDVRAAV